MEHKHVTLFLLTLFSFVWAYYDVVKNDNLECTAFTLDDCDRDFCEEKIIPHVKQMEQCQRYCAEVEQPFCQSFAYSLERQVCALYNCNLTDWVPFCKEVGGPKNPSYQECQITASGCGSFRESSCNYLGGIIQHNNVQSTASCQISCDIFHECQFFVYNTENKDCTLYNSTGRHCDVTLGPLTPDYESTCDIAEAVSLIIVVKDKESGQALSDVKIAFANVNHPEHVDTANTDDHGMANLGKFPPGTELRLQLSKEGYDILQSSIIIDYGTTEQTVTISMTSNISEFVDLIVTVTNAEDSHVLSDCLVSYQSLTDPNDVGQNYTGSDGTVTFRHILRYTNATISAEKDGFLSHSIDQLIVCDQHHVDIHLTPVPKVTVIVQTQNAVSNDILPGVEIYYENLEESGHGVTDDNGHFTVGQLLPNTELKLEAKKSGFEPYIVNMTITDHEGGWMKVPISLSPSIPEGGIRITMNWGPLPPDLDLNVMQVDPTTGNVLCTVFFGNFNCNGISLDVDNAQGGDNGAETVTITDGGIYVYTIYVHMFPIAGETPLNSSEARVSIQSKNSEAKIVKVPTEDPNFNHSKYWIVGCLFGPQGLESFQEINQLSSLSPNHKSDMCTNFYPETKS